jgi:O-Antigen ligase
MYARSASLDRIQVSKLLLTGSLVLGVSFGLVASYSGIFLAGLGIVALLGFAIAGEGTLLGLILISSGLTFGFLTGGDRPFLSGLANLDGVKLVAVLGAFAVLAVRNPSLLAGLTHLKVYLLFIALSSVSLMWSPSVADGIRFLCKLAYPSVAFLITYQIVRQHGDNAVVRYCCIGAIAATLLNLIVALGGWSPFQGIGYEERYRGAAHPNSIGLYCAAAGLMIYAFWVSRRSMGFLALSLALFAQVVATGSRTALIAGGVGVLLFELLRGKWRHTVVAFVLGTGAWMLVPTLGARTASTALDGGFGSQLNLSGRLFLWADAWVAFIGNGSLIGHGVGATEQFFESRYLGLRSVHNGYLLLLGDTGVLGLGLALSFLLGVAVLFFKQVRSGTTSVYSHLTIALVVMQLLASMMESTFGGYGPQTPLWVAMGAAFALMNTPVTKVV